MRRQLWTIVVPAVMEELGSIGAARVSGLDSHIKYYPDGAVCTPDPDKSIVDHVNSLLQAKGECPAANLVFRQLSCFDGEIVYQVLVPHRYARSVFKFDESVVCLSPGIGEFPREEEYDLGHLGLYLKFFPRLSSDQLEDLARTLWRWYLEIGQKGVWAEPGISGIGPALLYTDIEAAISLDATRTGQNTLNTLYLAVFDWAIDRRIPLDEIRLAAIRDTAVWSSKTFIPLAGLKAI